MVLILRMHSAPALLARGPRRFELRKPPEAREMRGRLRVTMQRKPRDILYFQFDRLEKPRYVAFEEGDRNPIAIEHSVHCKRREVNANSEASIIVGTVTTQRIDGQLVVWSTPTSCGGARRWGESDGNARRTGYVTRTPVVCSAPVDLSASGSDALRWPPGRAL